MESKYKANKHLTYEEREYIEIGLTKDRNFTEIAIEKNHEYIRYVLPKGSSFDELTQEKTNILMSNINSTSRDILNGKTPYEAMTLVVTEEIIEKLGIKKIKADDVNLSPKLLKDGGK